MNKYEESLIAIKTILDDKNPDGSLRISKRDLQEQLEKDTIPSFQGLIDISKSMG